MYRYRYNSLYDAASDQYYESGADYSPRSSSSSSPRTLVRRGSPNRAESSLAIFSFVSGDRGEVPRPSFQHFQQQLRAAVASSPLLRGPGLLMDSREKGVLFPMVHFTDDREAVRTRLHQPGSLLNHGALGPDWTLQQGVYREVRQILPDRSPGHEAEEGDESSFILIGFKSLDTTFSQVMVDTWKEWTGARSIYLHLPDELGLSRMSFYHRETPDDLSLFMYVVVVECRCSDSPARLSRLLDFTQRLRVERMAGYISVYSPLQTGALMGSVCTRVVSPTVLKHGRVARKLLSVLDTGKWRDADE